MMSHGMWGSMPRHHTAMMSSIPAPYNALRNPLSRTRATVERGEVVYDSNCASCHGPNGAGDGETGKGLNPPRGNLVWLSQMPMVEWDPFMYWTVAEGGAQFGIAMPAFKDSSRRTTSGRSSPSSKRGCREGPNRIGSGPFRGADDLHIGSKARQCQTDV